MANDDWRRRSPEFNSPRLERNPALRDNLRLIAERHGTISFLNRNRVGAQLLSWPGVTAAIVGARTPEQGTGGWMMDGLMLPIWS